MESEEKSPEEVEQETAANIEENEELGQPKFPGDRGVAPDQAESTSEDEEAEEPAPE